MAKTCPYYGIYSVHLNPFGTGFYHGWTAGALATDAAIMARYPDLDPEQLDRYRRGRDAGMSRDTDALAIWMANAEFDGEAV